MTDIIPFQYQDQEVRIIQDDDGTHWWVAKDICDILEHSDPHKAISALDEDERKKVPVIDSMSRTQDTWVVNESGLYTLIIRSNKPQAKPFRKWVTSEVLPSIRKSGCYALPQVVQQDALVQVAALQDQVAALMAAQQAHADQLTRIEKRIAPDFPVRKIQHPKGLVRVFLIHEKPMVLALDFIVIHKRRGALQNSGSVLKAMGFVEGRDVQTLNSSEIGLLYGAAPHDVLLRAGITQKATSLVFITPTGIERVKQIDQEFYDWYTEKATAVYGALLRIMHDIQRREVSHD